MKKFFLILCTVFLTLGTLLPLAAYRLTLAVLSREASPVPASQAVSPAVSASKAALPADADVFYFEDLSTGQVTAISRRDYILGAVAAEMPVSWPDEALKAQAVAVHSYALYCRDHSARENGAWLTADPARRQGCLTEPVLRSYWGTAYEENHARLSALVDETLREIVCYEGAPACTSYFAISNGQTEASVNVWDSALPYLTPVDSSTDRSADNYEYTITLSAGLPFLKNMTPPAGSKSVAELAEIVRLAERPFIVKGIMTVKGAQKAKEAGAAAIVVSNHGGRVLDQCPATAEVLPEIAAALKGTGVKILVDGGIRTGVDVFKALALGADGVLICRPFVTAVYGGGEEGVKCYIDKLAGELADTMQMCGAHSIAEITPDMVRV